MLEGRVAGLSFCSGLEQVAMPVSHPATEVMWPPLSTEIRKVRVWIWSLKAAEDCCRVEAGSEGGITLMASIPLVALPTSCLGFREGHVSPADRPHRPGTHWDYPLGPQRADANNSYLLFRQTHFT